MTGTARFASNGQVITLDVPPPKPKKVVVHGPGPIVQWDHPKDKHALLIFMPRDQEEWALTFRGRMARHQGAPLRIGSYTVFARVGTRIARQEITVRKGGCIPARIDSWSMHEGKRFKVRVLREGKPMAGAEIRVRAFRPAARRMSVVWGKTGEDGILDLTGLPLDCTGISGSAMQGGQGRGYSVTFADAKEPFDIDLGP